MTLPEFDCHCHILPGLDDGEFYSFLGIDTHNRFYTDFFDTIVRD